MSLESIQQKKQVIESRSRIREFVFGIQDGLISTVGLLAGIQSATENNLVVIVTGMTAMFSGAISMATMFDVFRKGEVLPAGRSDDEEVSLIGKRPPVGQIGRENQTGVLKIHTLNRAVVMSDK